MLRLIYGSKGSGKTGKIIDDANSYVQQAHGDLVFLTDTDKYTFKINHNIRLINIHDYDISSDSDLSGFIRGIIASNADVSHIYIDGVHRMTNMPLTDMQAFFQELDKISDIHQVELVITVSADALPAYMSNYPATHA